ncbi:GDSL-type esterase/lipase family protein [Pseudobacteroides cellulosolvens]|uniref:Lipolytic protein G-D-S-L family n=1 Tax=Pseudobacteroides cellulosolvens ATCC 35603 = DSM 2933 TaxID=398512 RepID=A0A0L6JJT0_9FIRM|nr:GDSL-type esterase/lipase family protein [Pseudobacteroides cellulosolvens]KNY26000.1 lipolytic protein G-D-S-L family [Pseudobacteroides cellulosolvens ATCC 35603 = DSM 2933]
MARKFKNLSVVMVIITILSTVSAFHNSVFSAEMPIKIMPLGDSITACGNWRDLLLSNLTSSSYNVEFVGSQYYLTAHEGHSGIGAINMASSGNLKTWLSATNPEIVIMHLGTNDSWGNNLVPQIIPAFTTLVGQMRANNPNMKIMVAKIIPMHPSGSGESANNNVLDLNSRIDDWAKGLSTSQSPIIVVDQYTGFDTKTDTYDGVHPNDNGCIKMADKWFAALKNVISPSSSATPTSKSASTPTPYVNSLDVNHDGAINMADVIILAKVFNSVSGDSKYVYAYDLNRDGAINISDIVLIASKFNTVV